VLIQARARCAEEKLDVGEALREFGGFEIAMLCGAYLGAAEAGLVVLVDGFIASVAWLCAVRLEPAVAMNAIYTHESAEHGHVAVLAALEARPLLALGMRLGEGSGAAVAWPLVQAAVALMNEMASFETAGVSEKT
jgi:nicotinate-nucleotide--dimethylbenzimidazole phosphoribosyltransferase